MMAKIKTKKVQIIFIKKSNKWRKKDENNDDNDESKKDSKINKSND